MKRTASVKAKHIHTNHQICWDRLFSSSMSLHSAQIAYLLYHMQVTQGIWSTYWRSCKTKEREKIFRFKVDDNIHYILSADDCFMVY